MSRQQKGQPAKGKAAKASGASKGKGKGKGAAKGRGPKITDPFANLDVPKQMEAQHQEQPEDQDDRFIIFPDRPTDDRPASHPLDNPRDPRPFRPRYPFGIDPNDYPPGRPKPSALPIRNGDQGYDPEIQPPPGWINPKYIPLPVMVPGGGPFIVPHVNPNYDPTKPQIIPNEWTTPGGGGYFPGGSPWNTPGKQHEIDPDHFPGRLV